MIGKAYVSTFPFYNIKNNKMSYKNRPVLIVGQADSTDYVVLPVSRVTNKHNSNDYYDVLIEPADFPLLNFKERSYIRTHKQNILNKNSLTKEITDFKKNYPNTYKQAIKKMEEFQKHIIKNA